MCSFYFSNQYLGNLEELNKFLKPRGPDYTNLVEVDGYTLVHNLLSLTGEFTIQPLSKNNIHVLFNGEIYNFKDFDSNAKCDSEVIIDLYQKYGPEFTSKLDGEYAILILDLNTKRIIFSADTFRTKPLFYSIEDKAISVSTYTTPILLSNFKKANKVEANTTYIYDIKSGQLTTRTITNFNLDQYKNNVDDWISKFDRAIEKRTKFSADKKFFIGLSSGYDSGIISCALNKTGIDYKAYSVAASENIDIIKQRFNLIKNKELINLKKSEFDYQSANLFGIKCEDFTSQDLGINIRSDKACYGLAHICTLAQRDSRKIYISGQGADEIISDYGMNGNKIYGHSTFGGVFPSDLRSVFPWKNFFKGTQELYISKEEYVAGSFGIESRYPFLDLDLVQEYLNLSTDVKNKKYKHVIHEYLLRNNFPFEQNKKIGFQANKNLQ
jgi:asparagine synthetase B (glutamine-hydrolysing)